MTDGQKKHKLQQASERQTNVHYNESAISSPENGIGAQNGSGRSERSEPVIPNITRAREKNNASPEAREKVTFSSDAMNAGLKTSTTSTTSTTSDQFLWKRQILDCELWAKELAGALSSERTDLRQAAATLEIWLGGRDIDQSAVTSAIYAINPRMMYAVNWQ